MTAPVQEPVWHLFARDRVREGATADMIADEFGCLIDDAEALFDAPRRGGRPKGSTHTAETRAKIGAAQKGRALSPEARAKMSAAASLRSFPPLVMQQVWRPTTHPAFLLGYCPVLCAIGERLPGDLTTSEFVAYAVAAAMGEPVAVALEIGADGRLTSRELAGNPLRDLTQSDPSASPHVSLGIPGRTERSTECVAGSSSRSGQS